jgi:uncharacterized protein (TIGR02147 family)
MLNVFQYSRYFRFLRDLSQKEDVTVTDLAKAAEVQRPYMSNVLGDRAYLSAEQGFRLCRFLGFSQKEQDYFLALVELEKASSGEYKNFLKKKIEALKQDSEKLINKLERPEAPKISEMAAEYYSSWEYCAIHVLTSIPEFQKLEAIATKMRLPEGFTQECLNKLLSWGLIKLERDRYLWASGNIHIPSNSAMVQLHHKNWREKSIEDARLNADNSLHFTSVYSVSQEDFSEVKDQMLDLIKAYNKRAAGSKEEELVCMNLDFFRLK